MEKAMQTWKESLGKVLQSAAEFVKSTLYAVSAALKKTADNTEAGCKVKEFFAAHKQAILIGAAVCSCAAAVCTCLCLLHKKK
jgi:hypothetical protein